MSDERRAYHRIPLSFPLQIRIANVGKFSEEYARDLSEGGMFIPMSPPLIEGAHVDLEFRLESSNETIRAQGRVVRSVQGGEGGKDGMAVAFTSLGRDARRLIEKVVRRFCIHHPSHALELPPDLLRGRPERGRSDPAHDRPRVDLSVSFRMPGAIEEHEHLGHTLRPGEIFVLTETPCDVGTELELSIAADRGDVWHPVKGVTQAKVYSPGTAITPGGAGMAISLRSPSPEVEALLSPPVPEEESAGATAEAAEPATKTIRYRRASLAELGIHPSILSRVDSEIFLRVREGDDREFSCVPSYVVAVRDCLDLGNDAYLLKVRPDMHRRLHSELQPGYEVHGVYEIGSDHTDRFVLLDRIFADFGPDSTPADRTKILTHYCIDMPADGGATESEYQLRPEFAQDPLAAARRMWERAPLAEISVIALRFLDWVPKSRSITDLMPMAEIGPRLTSHLDDDE